MRIRKALITDLDAVVAVEAECFPEAEAAGRESLFQRLRVYPEHFWVLEEKGQMIGFVNGMTTDEENLRDEMYENAGLHDEKGCWQMIFGVDVIPAYRRRGCAAILLKHIIEDARIQNREGLVLTCKDKLVQYYAKFGFLDEGISESGHGGVVWHQMRLKF